MEVMIPANKVGLIIGKGGETIKQLQNRTGCKMMMVQDGPYQNAPEKPLKITGKSAPPASLAAAFYYIYHSIRLIVLHAL